MKDPGGHGSNSKGSNSALTATQGPKSPMPRGPSGKGGKGKFQVGGGVSNAPNPTQIHGGVPVTSNAQAAHALMSTLKSTMAPLHSAMANAHSPDGGSAS